MVDKIYTVVGKYIENGEVTGYKFKCSDGTDMYADITRTTYLIYNGKIVNMRIQPGNDNKPIIRGKGINLNNLPVLDKNDIPKDKNLKKDNEHGRIYTITKRMVYKDVCIGYVLEDDNGKAYRKSKNDVNNLAIGRRISNATARKWLDSNNKPRVLLRGIGVDINTLPIVYVDSSGKVIDTTRITDSTTFRILKTAKGGILYHNNDNIGVFRAGDYIIFDIKGDMHVESKSSFQSKAEIVDGARESTCDFIVRRAPEYSIEIFGMKKVRVSSQDILDNWGIAKMKI